jgi:hypothetical protein
MRPPPLLVALATAALLIGCDRTPDPYAAYRQTKVEDVPGTFDWQLQPVGDFAPTVDPQTAYAKIFEAGVRPMTMVVLAQVHNTDTDTTGPPAWVFITPDMCFATAKGDLVSPGRSGDGCTDENLYVQGVDATNGEVLGGFPAFDTPEGWTPARAGTPPELVVQTQEGATRLH